MSNIMDYIRDRNGKDAHGRPAVDMDKLAKAIKEDVRDPPPLNDPYAPKRPAPRPEDLPDMAVRVIATFGALPKSELDELISAAEEQIGDLKKEAQEIRDQYVRRTDALSKEIKRLTAGCTLARDTLGQLRKQVAELDAPELTPPDEYLPT